MARPRLTRTSVTRLRNAETNRKQSEEKVTFRLVPQPLDHGQAEERAGFGLLEITVNGRLMTEGFDEHTQGYATGPRVSGYHFAEWLVWNWWRLRWEPGPPGKFDRDGVYRWDSAHRTATIGEGYVWPNVVISSDGFRCALIAEPSQELEAVPFRYLGAARMEVIPAGDLEAEIDRFARQVLEILDNANVHDTNLHRLWSDLRTERTDPDSARFRRLEARLGFEPDEIDERTISSYLDDAKELGDNAVEELAAHAAHLDRGANMASAAALRQISIDRGFDANAAAAVRLNDAVRLNFENREWTESPAWQTGEDAARALRRQENLGTDPVCNARLADLAGTTMSAIENNSVRSDELSFAIAGDGSRSRLALRPKWETGRRFDLARLIGDRLVDGAEPLLPATRAHSYRQKAQRAFAAELLSPYDAVDDMLDIDISEERQTEVAEHFQISPLAIRTLLMNKGRISRDNAPFVSDRLY